MSQRGRAGRARRLARDIARVGPRGALAIASLGVRVIRERPGPLRERICAEVLTWPGVTRHRHRFGGVELRHGRRELGHIHANHLVDLPFPVRVRDELVRDGRAQPHHILPRTGWVSYPLHDGRDVAGAVALFRLAWQRAVASEQRRAGRA